jgi:CDP-diacylglycerol--glycerol-3-phosphate 3-phosphatidyltransferase
VNHLLKARAKAALDPVARLLANLGVAPDHLTWTGLVASLLAGVLAAVGWIRISALVLLVAAFCDMLDGSVARVSGTATRFGAFLDSTVDRISESVYFAGLLVFFTRVEPSLLYGLLAFFAMTVSFLVSYTRARSEGLGIPCSVGWMERPERLTLLLVAALVGPLGIKVALWLLVPLAAWTSVQRIRHVREETRFS